MTNLRSKMITGFTLIEMLLVLVIVSMFIYMSVGYIQQKTLQMRIDRTSIQMQQILNAGMAYYVANGTWPQGPDLTNLQGSYLPPSTVTFQSPWAEPYKISVYSPTITPAPPVQPPPQFYVWTAITAAASSTSGSATAAANIIAGTLPLAYTTTDTTGSATNPPVPGSNCTADSTTCYVVASVNIPGQNLNNARAVNFAGLYHHGACVPVPQCPVDSTGTTMVPQIMVVPVSVSGLNNTSNPGQSNVYPISSFTAYAKPMKPVGTDPDMCDHSNAYGGTGNTSCTSNNNGPTANVTAYWRVCLQVTTEAGNVQTTSPNGANTGNANFGQNVTLMAVTRCAVQNEPAGSNFNVWTN